MPIEENKALILQFCQPLSDRKIDRALNLLVLNFEAYLAGIPEPLDVRRYKQFDMSFYLAFSRRQQVFDGVVDNFLH